MASTTRSPTFFGSRPLVARRSASIASSLARICGPPMWSGRLRAPRGIFVLTGPGHSTETPTLVPSSSCSNASDRERTAYLLIEYGPWSVLRRFWKPATEAVLTICPSSPCLRIAGTKWRMPWMTPQIFTPITNSQSPGRQVGHFSAVHRHAGIVAGDVELAKIAFGFSQGIEHGLLLRHIDPDRHDPLVRAGETMSRLLDNILLDIGHDHIRTGLRERGRNAEANAGSGTGYDGGFAGDVHSRGAFRIVNENSGPSRWRSSGQSWFQCGTSRPPCRHSHPCRRAFSAARWSRNARSAQAADWQSRACPPVGPEP